MNWYKELKFASNIYDTRTFLKKMRALGFIVDPARNGGGSHHYFVHPSIPHPQGRAIAVPVHDWKGGLGGSSQMSPGLSKTIITRYLGLSPEDFNKGRNKKLWSNQLAKV